MIAVKNENQIIGPIGHCIEKLLIKKDIRKCRIIGRNDFGMKLDNGTWSGIIGKYIFNYL